MIEMRADHKATAAGHIPRNWQDSTIGECVNFSGGTQPPRTTFTFSPSPDNIRLVQIRDYKSNDFATYIPKILARKFCDEHDIMIGRYGPPVFQILRGIEGAYNVALIKATNLQCIDREFLYYVLTQPSLFNLIDSLSRRTSGQTGVEMPALRAFPLPLPPLPEQQAIAKALGDVDWLIASLEALIAKKRDIKQGAMQELLSGHRRLPGFAGDWTPTSLKTISAFITKGSTPTTYGFGWVSNGILFLRSECVSEDGLELDQSMMISEEAHRVLSRSEIKAGDLLITITGNVGRVVFLDDSFPVANINQHIARIRISNPEVEARFVFHYLKQDRCLKYFNSITTGQAYPQLSLRQVREMNIPLPSKDEQSAIAGLLSGIDAEIAALEAKLSKTRDVKQGMMQVLLTGEVRLI